MAAVLVAVPGSQQVAVQVVILVMGVTVGLLILTVRRDQVAAEVADLAIM
tara:strand:+ start:586 stop:735 length:150 start_codon:yes stop_codon:yes gene_type:complete